MWIYHWIFCGFYFFFLFFWRQVHHIKLFYISYYLLHEKTKLIHNKLKNSYTKILLNMFRCSHNLQGYHMIATIIIYSSWVKSLIDFNGSFRCYVVFYLLIKEKIQQYPSNQLQLNTTFHIYHTFRIAFSIRIHLNPCCDLDSHFHRIIRNSTHVLTQCNAKCMVTASLVAQSVVYFTILNTKPIVTW